MVCVFILQNEGGGKHQVTLGNEEADKLLYFGNRVQDFWHGIRLGKSRNINDLVLASRELVNLSEDHFGTEKKLSYINRSK